MDGLHSSSSFPAAGRYGRAGGWSAATSEPVLIAALSAAALSVVVGFLWMAATMGPDVWVPTLVALVILAISIPVCLSTAGPDARLRRLLVLGLVLKLLCVFPRYGVNELVYGGNSDAGIYHEGGLVLRENVQDGQWNIDGAYVASFPSETQFVAYVTGAIYLVTGASQMVAYVVFAWLGWIGLMCMFRAFRLAYPNAPPHLAAKLLFFLPSLLYWPSSLGKDAVMLFGIGLMVLGVARLMMASRAWLGVVWIVIGAYPMLAVRPHLLLIALVGGAVSLLARNADGAPTGAVLTRGVLLVALVPALFLGLARMNQTFGANGDSGFTVSGALNKTATMSSIGGSAFATRPVQSPVDFPVALVNVLYRPFIFEVRSVPALVSGLEGTALIIMTVMGARWLWRIGPEVRRNPLIAFCAGYVLAFVFAFANVGNAGILARQRIQMFPLLMLMVAAAAEAHRLNSLEVAADVPRVARTPFALPSADPRLVTVP